VAAGEGRRDAYGMAAEQAGAEGLRGKPPSYGDGDVRIEVRSKEMNEYLLCW